MEDPQIPGADVDKEVHDTVAHDHYARALTQPAEARSRAEIAYTVAAAITGGLLATGVVTNIQDRSRSVQILGVAALVVWLLTAALFVIARARPFVRATPQTQGRLAFVEAALAAAESERAAIDRWLRAAAAAAALATVLTLIAFAFATFGNEQPETSSVRVRLSTDGRAAMRSVCTHKAKTVAGNLELGSLEKDFVVIHLGPDQCVSRDTTLRLRRADVLAVRANPE